jgi:2-alkyl-3-oxoalkanoate reductase
MRSTQVGVEPRIDDVAQVLRSEDCGGNIARSKVGSCDVLVTGGSGRLGSLIVDALVAKGLRVRVFARRQPQNGGQANVEYSLGELGDPASVERAVRGASAVVHAGAAMSGDASSMRSSTVLGTSNVLDSMIRHGVRRLVHISSLSVIDWAGNDDGEPVTEDTKDEPQAERRGLYTQTKLEAERLVRAASARVQAVILRPGQIWGGGILPLLTDAVCRRIGPFNLVLGDGQLTLPLVHVDDVVQAVLKSLERNIPSGTVIQLVNPAVYTQNDVMEIWGVGGITVRLPRSLVLTMGWLSEQLLVAFGRQSPFSVYRLRSALARLEFRSEKAQEMLGWEPHGNETELMQRERRMAADS